MPRILPVLIVALLVIYCVVEVAQADPDRVRLMPRWLWAVLVIALPGLGALAWLLLGRPVRTLLKGKQSAGFHELKVNLNSLSTGIYLVQVQVGDKAATRRLEVTR